MRATHDVTVREVACVGAPRTLLCVEIGDRTQSQITIAAGVHGDEPTGPLALLHLVENRLVDPRYAYRLWPCLNPTGYDAGTRESIDGIDIRRTFGRGGSSPEAKAVIMANRDLKFVLAIDIHENCEGETCGEAGLTFTSLLARNAAARAVVCEHAEAVQAAIAQMMIPE